MPEKRSRPPRAPRRHAGSVSLAAGPAGAPGSGVHTAGRGVRTGGHDQLRARPGTQACAARLAASARPTRGRAWLVVVAAATVQYSTTPLLTVTGARSAGWSALHWMRGRWQVLASGAITADR